MSFTWFILGAPIGVIHGLDRGGGFGIVAMMIGGMIWFPILGLFLGLIGGDARSSVIGAAIGLVGCCFVALDGAAAN